MATIKWLENEIIRLKADINSDKRQADRFTTQANYHETTEPEISAISRQTAGKYSREAEEFENKIAEYQRQIDDLKQQVSQLSEERDSLRRQADEKDRQIIDITG